MKKLIKIIIFGFLTFSISSCSDILDWSGALLQKTSQNTWNIKAQKTGRLSVTSDKSIELLTKSAENVCTKRQSILADGAEALSCRIAKLPFEIDIKSDGSVVGRVLN